MRKSRGMILSLILALFICGVQTKTFAAEVSENGYQSHGTTSFYGKYERHEQDETGGDSLSDRNGKNTGGAISGNPANTLPGYQGKGTIIPQTGDSDASGYQLLGLAILLFGTLVIFKEKRQKHKETRGVY